MPSILSQDPHGRLDIALVRATELVIRRAVEPRVGIALWDGWGVGDLVERVVVERLKVPATPVTLVDVARVVGVLERRPR